MSEAEFAMIDAYYADRLQPARAYWTTDRRTIERTRPHLTRLRLGKDDNVTECGQGQLIACTRAYWTNRIGERSTHRLAKSNA